MREEELKEEFDMGTFLQSCTKKGIKAVCRQFAVSATKAEIAKYALPILGSIINGAISYRTTSYCLTTILEDIYKTSVEVSEKNEFSCNRNICGIMRNCPLKEQKN
jgi:hypothetical protein